MTSPGVTPVAMLYNASRGICAAIARELHASGWQISLALRLGVPAPVSGDNVLIHRYETCDEAAQIAWRDATLARFGRISGIVLNAGDGIGTVIGTADNARDGLSMLKQSPPMRLAEVVWPALEAARGRIIVLSTIADAGPEGSAAGLRATSHFAVSDLAEGLRKCGKTSNVRTTAISPSFVDADLAPGGLAAKQMASAEDLARIIRIVLEMPPTASLPEIPVHYSVEDCV